MSAATDKTADFVELKAADQKLPVVCDLVARHYERGETVAVFTPDPAEAEQLDSLLWTFRQNSFIPHVRIESAREPLVEPVIIFSGEPGDLRSDVLVIVSAQDIPEWFSGFGVIHDFAEIYDQDRRQASRARFTAYRAAGYRMLFTKS